MKFSDLYQQSVQAKERRGEVKSCMPGKCMTYSRKKKKRKITSIDKFNVFVFLLLFIVLLQVGFGHVCYRPIVSYYERLSVETATTADVDTDTGVAGYCYLIVVVVAAAATRSVVTMMTDTDDGYLLLIIQRCKSY